MGEDSHSLGFVMWCGDCKQIHAPLGEEIAVELATLHCERFEHTSVGICPLMDFLPIHGKLHRETVDGSVSGVLVE